MPAAMPFVFGQQGAPTRGSRNQYALPEDTRDQSQDGVKYPLHRLLRDPEQERVRRIRARISGSNFQEGAK